MEAMNEAWPPRPCQVCHPGPLRYMNKGMALISFYQRAPPNSTRRHNLVKMMVNDGHATNVTAVTRFLTSLDRGECFLNPLDRGWDGRRNRRTRTSREFHKTGLHYDNNIPKPFPYISNDRKEQNAYLSVSEQTAAMGSDAARAS